MSSGQSRQISVDEAMRMALAHHGAGRLQEAEAIYRQILAAFPQHADANHFLGVIAHQVGRNEVAEPLIRQSIALRPGVGAYHNNLGQVLRGLGRAGEAVEEFRRAAELEPVDVTARCNAAIALREAGRVGEAVEVARQAVTMAPDRADAAMQLAASLQAAGDLVGAAEVAGGVIARWPGVGEAHEVLGSVHQSAGRLDEAAACFRRAAELLPSSPSPLNNLAITLARESRRQEAAEVWRQVVRSHPKFGDGYVNLGQVLCDLGQHEEAAAMFGAAIDRGLSVAEAHRGMSQVMTAVARHDEAVRHAREAARLVPGSADAANSLGVALWAAELLEEATSAWRRAIELSPSSATAYNNVAAAMTTLGAAHEAIPYYRKVVELDPGLHAAHSNMLLDLHYVDDLTPEQLLAEHVAWADRHAAGVDLSPPDFAYVDRDPGRRLHVGYFSPDFRAHSVSDFIEPVLAGHDRERFEVFCYASVQTPDVVTERLKGHVPHWRDVSRLTDEEAAAMVRRDGIDVFVDLAGHTANGRMKLLARRLAPVQVTYLGYPDTTGLRTVDYRLTDAAADPEGMTDAYHTERLVRLPRTAWCYHAFPDSPAVAPVPADAAAGHVTFGSFNNLAKTTPGLVALWARVLAAVPGSRLLLKASGLSSESARQRVWGQFAALGVPRERVELAGRVEDFVQHLAAYGQVDVALDTYPYHGTTTTCEALYMGAPVVTLAGRTHVSRVGVSLLGSVGLGDLIAADADGYVARAASLAGDLPRLRELRRDLRDRMRRSPLMDPVAFVRDVEAAYRRMWAGFCARTPA